MLASVRITAIAVAYLMVITLLAGFIKSSELVNPLLQESPSWRATNDIFIANLFALALFVGAGFLINPQTPRWARYTGIVIFSAACIRMAWSHVTLISGYSLGMDISPWTVLLASMTHSVPELWCMFAGFVVGIRSSSWNTVSYQTLLLLCGGLIVCAISEEWIGAIVVRTLL